MNDKRKSKQKRNYSDDNPFDIAPAPTTKPLISLRMVEIIIAAVALIIGINYLMNIFDEGDEGSVVTVTLAPTEPPTYEEWIAQGRQAFDGMDYADAESAFTMAIELMDRDEPDPEPYYRRGVTRYYLEAYDEAIADLTRALRYEYQTPAFAYYFRGRSYQELENYDAALENFNLSIEFCERDEADSNDCYLDWRRRGEVQFALNQFDKALSDLNKSLDIRESAETVSVILDVYAELERLNPDAVSEAELLRYQQMAVQLNTGEVTAETVNTPAFEAGEPFITTFEAVNNDDKLILTFSADATETYRITAERIPRLTGERASDITPVILIQDVVGDPVEFVTGNDDKIALIEAFTPEESGMYTIVVASEGAKSNGRVEVRVSR